MWHFGLWHFWTHGEVFVAPLLARVIHSQELRKFSTRNASLEMALVGRLFAAESTLEIQLTLVAIYALFWYHFVEKASARLGDYLKKQPYVHDFTYLSQRTFRSGYYVDLSREQAFDLTLFVGAVLCQHLVGGALCLPSVLGGAGSLATSLAMHGGLCEAGWEVSDIVSRGGQLLFGGERGRKRNPRNLVLILAGHHLMGQLMVVPMNLRHRGSRDYHEMIMLLQFAAFWAGFFQLYGYTLDLDVPAQFRRMQISVSVTLGAVLWSRGFRYVVVGRRLLAALDGEPRMRACGALVLSIMGIFNAFVIYDCGKKFMKFCGPPKLRRRFTSSAALVDAPSDGAPPPASPPRLRRRPGSSRGA